MHRRTRAYYRWQRERWIAKRRRKFSNWVSEYDWNKGAPRPRHEREAEFWTPRQIGLLAKWNGTCDICARHAIKYRNLRHKERAAVRKTVNQVLIGVS